MKRAYVYIMASKPYGTLYVGVTSDLIRRVSQHKDRAITGFSSKYDVKHLIWYEVHEDIREALIREKRIKKWKRDYKIELIEKENPDWADLFQML